MSLLLDALKKAAQKKAKKSGAPGESIDPTEIADDQDTVALTQHDDTAINDTVVLDPDATQVNPDTQFTETEIDSTAIDQTELNETSVDLEPTQLEQNTQFSEATEIDPTAIEETEIDDDPTVVGENVGFDDSTEMDVTFLDETEVNGDTEMEYQSRLAEDDTTLYIHDDDELLLNEENDSTESLLTDTDAVYRSILEDEKEDLTEDDVTQFMGDGDSSQNTFSSDGTDNATETGFSDTTFTNPESLTLTNYSFADDEVVESVTEGAVLDLNESNELSLHEYAGREEFNQADTDDISQQDIPDDEKLTVINTDTVSSVDIEKLTNDETVTVGGTTSSKSFAPDNYDRTLLNLSEKDVSNIFPGLRPDSDTVMTPDYAKRIFLSKSSQAKTRYYKLYASLGLIFILSVIMWGFYQLQEETENVEKGLVSLKRDPMPGMIKPKAEKLARGLFVNELSEAPETDVKVIDLLSKTGGLEVDENSQMESESTAATVDEDVAVATETLSAPPPVKDQAKLSNAVSAISKKPVQSKPPSTADLKISSSSKASRKNQLLMEAYEAYQQGDMATARTLYNEVLSVDKSNRDGILGRAAIHVLDNEYQQAIDKYQQLLVSNPKDGMAMAALISVANIDPQSGETQLKSLLRDQPESPYLHFVLGNMYGSQNRWSEAQSAYFEALQKKPNDPNYAYNLAVSLEHIGKAGAAVTFYQRALKNSSNGLVTFDDQMVVQRVEVLTQ